ncbi:ubiquitin protein ligase binding protein [Aureococcus anophagefferens]|uniref:Ubiquitin protein ligase binding protein n=1 Tax=Aureococcus anophagefferens TaxID=44056 RepID=A0ABR1FST4_AURAN
MNVFRLKTFDETWALLRRRLACVFDEALCDDVDPELPSKTETYNIVRDCCFIERWQEQLYAVCAPELQAPARPGPAASRPRRGRGRRRRAARRRRERVGLLEQAALPGRRLGGRPDLAADVEARFGDCVATLDATLAQALLLVALNGGAALSAGAAAAAAGLDRATLSPAAAAASANVVAADGGGAYAANAAFPGRGRVRLPAPAAPSGADGGAGDARKTLSHAALLGDVFAQLKRPASTADVKARVESLIEREYLERDPRDAGVYNYLA